MPLPTASARPYLHSDCVSTPDVQTRLSPGAASHDGMFVPHPPPDSPAGFAPNPHPSNARPPLLSFNRRISDGASTNAPADVDAGDRLPHVGLPAAASHGGSRRSVHPILSMRRRQTDFVGGMQVQIPQQSMSSPSQGSQVSQFRLSLPSLAPKTSDQPSPTSQPTDSDQALQSRSLSSTPAKAQAPAHVGPSLRSTMQPPSKPKPLPGASATPGYSLIKPAFMTQVPAVPENSMFLATPFTAQARCTVLTSLPPPIRAPPLSPHAHEPQQQQQLGAQRPAADSKDDAEPHYELDADFEAEAAKQRRMSSAMYIKTPAGQEKGLDGGAPVPTEVAQRDEEEDEYEDEEKHWEPKEALLHWLDANVGLMKKKGRVA